MKTCLTKSLISSNFFPTTAHKITPKFSHFSNINNGRFQMIKSSPSTVLKMKYMGLGMKPHKKYNPNPNPNPNPDNNVSFRRSVLIAGAASVGLTVLLMMGFGGDDRAWAFGPEGPLVEEFWENVRRYALYALTVSTGVLYAVFQPIFELLKNPISAVLILIIIGGSFFMLSQILSAMVGVSEFNYDYAY